MKKNERSKMLLAGLLVLPLSLAGSLLLADSAAAPQGQAFDSLTPEVDIVYLLANSSLIIGPDVEGPEEDITFTGTVAVPKFPVAGFERHQLPSGRYQIEFELTDSQLEGESYLMNGPVHLGEHPDLRSLGTITQAQKGKDYPANFIVQRKVLIETPKGQMYNEEPVPVRGRINSIPPVRTENEDETNVFRGKELPIPLLDQDGSLAGWFYSTVHVAYAVDPTAIYRVPVSGTVTLKVGDEEEPVAVSGPMELVEIKEDPGKAEIVKMALRGESRLLGGPIMFTETFDPEGKFSKGVLGTNSNFDLYMEIKTPGGILLVDDPVAVKGATGAPTEVDQENLGKAGFVPVYHVAMNEVGTGGQAITDQAGRRVGSVTRVNFGAERVAGHRPCCPRPGASKTAAAGTTTASGGSD